MLRAEYVSARSARGALLLRFSLAPPAAAQLFRLLLALQLLALLLPCTLLRDAHRLAFNAGYLLFQGLVAAAESRLLALRGDFGAFSVELYGAPALLLTSGLALLVALR